MHRGGYTRRLYGIFVTTFCNGRQLILVKVANHVIDIRIYQQVRGWGILYRLYCTICQFSTSCIIHVFRAQYKLNIACICNPSMTLVGSTWVYIVNSWL